MAYGSSGKSAATGYTAFNNRTSDNALENSADSSTPADGPADNMVAARKKALKKRLLAMKGN